MISGKKISIKSKFKRMCPKKVPNRIKIPFRFLIISFNKKMSLFKKKKSLNRIMTFKFYRRHLKNQKESKDCIFGEEQVQEKLI